jgi:fatty-acyl-CoA synthase
MVNLSSFIRFHALRTPNRLAIVYKDQRITYAALLERIELTAGWLAQRGIGAGDIVAVFLKNSAAFIELAFAASHLGAIFLPINFRLAATEVAYILENAGAKIMLADAEFEPLLGTCFGAVYVDTAAQSNSTKLAGDVTMPHTPMTTRKPEDLFRLMYTSGTTDRPKGVAHTYGNFYWKCADHVLALGLGAADRLLVTGPLYHVGAFDLPGIAVLWVGGMLYIHRQFDAVQVLSSIAEEKLNCAWLAPVMLTAALGHSDRGQYDVSGLRWVIGGGERTPESRIREFSGYFTGGRYIDAYGLTETGSGDTLMEAGREFDKIGSTGRALAHVEIQIADDRGRDLPAGETGEICLRGPKVFSAYWKDPDRSKASFFGDWFRTGDVGYIDGEGFLYLTDRKKDMIISGGENIASSEVERVIYHLPQVREVAVIGLPDDRWGERPVAVVVLGSGQTLDPKALIEHCRRYLGAFKVPSEVVVCDTLPRNPSGKILKRVLREELTKKLQG